MNTLHLTMIAILFVFAFANINHVFADNAATSYGGLVGWRQADFKSGHGNYPIWYKITNGTVISTPLDLPSKTLFFMIKAPYDGQLIVQLPRSIIDSKNQGIDQPYFVEVQGNTGSSKVNVTDTSDEYLRTLKINFTKYASEIKIVGTFFVENHQPVTKNPFKLLSPLKQFKSGIATNDVKCQQDLSLIFKSEDGSPACVKPDTASKLVELGWGTTDGTSFDSIGNNEKNGTLSGNVSLAGGPRSGSIANYEVDVYATDGTTIVAKTLSDVNAHYSISLPTGNYIIYLPDYPTKQTHSVSVFSGNNTIFNIVYGIGYK